MSKIIGAFCGKDASSPTLFQYGFGPGPVNSGAAAEAEASCPLAVLPARRPRAAADPKVLIDFSNRRLDNSAFVCFMRPILSNQCDDLLFVF